MKSHVIRQKFLDFFAAHQHSIVSSYSLVPHNDPTLLFTNAGMVQFKDVFLGHEKRDNSRATSSQLCVRAGGKHNDLDNVGYTARHHTLFEMLGNFSFGDYFKREAIQFAWKFLTEELQLPQEKLWVTVYEKDDEAADIWLNEMGVDASRFSRCGDDENFWSMGPVGPCGPCTEIFYDHGPEIPGGPPGSPDADGDRYIEIWNLVFMQYNRDESGDLTPLPKPSVDTGMGLERIAAVMQGVHENYDIDLFQTLIDKAMEVTGCNDRAHRSLRVLADHIRSTAFLIADGVLPDNEGRGYVLRRIMRRACRHGHQLGAEFPFFSKLLPTLVEGMGEHYQQLVKEQARIEKVIKMEETQFSQTLEQGMQLLNNAIEKLSDQTLPGDVIFRLYDTYGFPVDLTADVARERGLTLDMPGFETCMAHQRAQSKQASQFGVQHYQDLSLEAKTEFTGYTEQVAPSTQIMTLLHDGKTVDTLTAGQSGAIVLKTTPFYAESGGQAGDRGAIQSEKGDAIFQVADTQKQGDAFIHYGELTSGQLKTSDQVTAKIDVHGRQATANNHSATHLLHAALRAMFGDQLTQKGSLVEADRLRFDFTLERAVTAEELDALETVVNEKIRENLSVETNLMSVDEAMQSGAMALFGEKYSDTVRVLSMGDFSKELCGGTHVKRTGEIGFFKITGESSVAAGIRRIDAVTGKKAIEWAQAQSARLRDIASVLKASPEALTDKLSQQVARQRELEKQLQKLEAKLATATGRDLASEAIQVAGMNILAARLDDVDIKTLRSTLDGLKDRLAPAAIVLASVKDDKVHLVAGVTKESTDKVQAGALVNHVAQQVGGKGGGRPDMAQAGGNNPEHLDAALASIPDWITQKDTA